MQRLSALTVLVALGAVLSSCNNQDNVELESAAAEAAAVEPQVAEDLRKFCTSTMNFASITLDKAEDLEGGTSGLLAAVAIEPSLAQFVEPLKAYREYVDWADGAVSSIQTIDSAAQLLAGVETSDALESGESTANYYRNRFSISEVESAVASFTDIEQPPVSAKSIESDFLVACASLN